MADLIIVIFTMILCYFGWMRGFARSFFGLLTWLCSGYLTTLLMPHTLVFIKVSNGQLRDLLNAGVCGIISLMLVAFVARKLADSLQSKVLGDFDYSFGLLFGFVKAYFILSIMFFVGKTMFPKQIMAYGGFFLPYLHSGSELVQFVVPELMDLKKQLNINNSFGLKQSNGHMGNPEDLEEDEISRAQAESEAEIRRTIGMEKYGEHKLLPHLTGKIEARPQGQASEILDSVNVLIKKVSK